MKALHKLQRKLSKLKAAQGTAKGANNNNNNNKLTSQQCVDNNDDDNDDDDDYDVFGIQSGAKHKSNHLGVVKNTNDNNSGCSHDSCNSNESNENNSVGGGGCVGGGVGGKKCLVSDSGVPSLCTDRKMLELEHQLASMRQMLDQVEPSLAYQDSVADDGGDNRLVCYCDSYTVKGKRNHHHQQQQQQQQDRPTRTRSHTTVRATAMMPAKRGDDRNMSPGKHYRLNLADLPFVLGKVDFLFNHFQTIEINIQVYLNYCK